MLNMEINNLNFLKINNKDKNNTKNHTFLRGIKCPNLAPLEKDTVSFKGRVFKKTDFQGIDYYVIERFQPNIQKFKTKEDLQTFANNLIKEIKEKDYPARKDEISAQRKAMLNEWYKYILEENKAYTTTQRLIILKSITKNLSSNNDSIPPVLNKGVLASTITEINNRLEQKPNEKIDFNKIYQNKLMATFLEETNTGETETKWIIIPSKTNDPENFEHNVDKLKVLSHKNWCTKSYNAKPYLEQGDFHVYLENGQPKLGVRFEKNKIAEIQGELNDSKIPIKYLEEFKTHQKEGKYKLTSFAKEALEDAENHKILVEEAKAKLGKATDVKTIDDAIKILKYLDTNPRLNNDNTLTISSYGQGRILVAHLSDLGIKENDLFKYIKKINGNANFENTEVTNLGNLEYIGKNASFEGSRIENLGNLQVIGGDANFECSKLTSLNKLNCIKGSANFEYSMVEDLGELLEIGLNANFKNSQIKTLGKLEEIKRNADFSNSEINDIGNLEIIGNNAIFSNSKITNLKNLETIGGNADFQYSDVSNLSQLKKIGKNADFRESKIKTLGNLKYIGGDVDLRYTNINSLGKLETVDGIIQYDDEIENLVFDFINNIDFTDFDEKDYPTDDDDKYDENDYYGKMFY